MWADVPSRHRQCLNTLGFSRNCYMNFPAWLKTMASMCALCAVQFWAVRVGLDQLCVLGVSFQTHRNHFEGSFSGEKWAMRGERTGSLAWWRVSPREGSTSSKGRLSPQHVFSSMGSSVWERCTVWCDRMSGTEHWHYFGGESTMWYAVSSQWTTICLPTSCPPLEPLLRATMFFYTIRI